MRHVALLLYVASLATGCTSIWIVELVRDRIPWLRDVEIFELFALPAYFGTLNALSISFSIRYFNQPAYLEDQKLTEHFLSSYVISAREAEVITLLILGLSYQQIGDKLFVAYKNKGQIVMLSRRLGHPPVETDLAGPGLT